MIHLSEMFLSFFTRAFGISGPSGPITALLPETHHSERVQLEGGPLHWGGYWTGNALGAGLCVI